MVTSSPTRHVNADKTHKLIRDYEVTAAAAHDSRVLETLRDGANTCKDVFADSAYRSAETERETCRARLSQPHLRARDARPSAVEGQGEDAGHRVTSSAGRSGL